MTENPLPEPPPKNRPENVPIPDHLTRRNLDNYATAAALGAIGVAITAESTVVKIVFGSISAGLTGIIRARSSERAKKLQEIVLFRRKK